MEVSHRTKSVCYFDLLYIQPLYFTSPSDMIIVFFFSYRVCSVLLSVLCTSYQSLRERASGRGWQFSRDALGARPSRAHQIGADPAALHVSYTFAGCHRHLQGCGSLSDKQTFRTERRLTLLHMQAAPQFMSLKTNGRESEWDVETNESATQTHE